VSRLTNNLGLKLLALSLAALLSVYVYLYIDYPTTQSLQLPLRVRNLQSNLIITQPQPFPEVVQISVRGPYRLIRQLTASNLSAWIDMRDNTIPESDTLPVQVPDLGEVMVTKQEPEILGIRTELREEATMALTVRKVGEIDSNFSVGNELLSRSSVTIKGPEPLVSQITSCELQVNLDGAEADISATFPVQLRDQEGKLIDSPLLTIEPEQVDYSLRLIPIGSIRVLQIIPETVGLPPEGFMLAKLIANPPRVQLPSGLVPGDVSFIRTAPIDVTDARETFTTMVPIVYPFETEGFSIPSECEVTLEITSMEELGSIRVEPELTNADPGFKYIITPPQFSVISERFAEFDDPIRDEVRAEVNVAGLREGEHYIAPQVFLPPGIDNVKINPSLLRITILKSEG